MDQPSFLDAFHQLLHIFIHSDHKGVIREVIDHLDGDVHDPWQGLCFPLLIGHEELSVPRHS